MLRASVRFGTILYSILRCHARSQLQRVSNVSRALVVRYESIYILHNPQFSRVSAVELKRSVGSYHIGNLSLLEAQPIYCATVAPGLVESGLDAFE